MKIAGREIGPGHPPYVIAELGVNHDGAVDTALAMTSAAADAGADAVKLQFFQANRLLGDAAALAGYQKRAGATARYTDCANPVNCARRRAGMSRWRRFDSWMMSLARC